MVSRNGVAQYRGTDVSRDSIGRALEAGSVVAGSVEQVGDMLRLTVRLADGLSGADLERPRTFDVPAEGVLAAQDSLATSVAIFLRQRLGDQVNHCSAPHTRLRFMTVCGTVVYNYIVSVTPLPKLNKSKCF